MLRIITDSSVDLTNEELEKYNVTRISMNVTIGDKSYKEGVDLTPHEFYEKVDASESFPKSASPSPMDFVNAFEEVADSNDYAICITIAQSLSGTYNVARMALDMVDTDRVYVLDSNTLSCGIQQLILEIDRVKDQMSFEELCSYLEVYKTRIVVLSGLDSIEYLKRGGRLGGLASFVSSVLKIKPLASFSRGVINIFSKPIGVIRSLPSVIDFTKKYAIDFSKPVIYGFSYAKDFMNKVIDKVTSEYGNHEYQTYEIGSSVGTHVGPNAFAICYIEAEEK